ncbi:alpha/beta hydrolase [Thiomonas sp. FB-Cd]|uniref:alpha/beta hydrolase n=1 Tax=Thiomonas sp. FB-Cd TaxID=1158292 RepID=UPI0004DEF48F|nr:alpha/beta hydrolase [Thiomonas sp. FB-Cd]
MSQPTTLITREHYTAAYDNAAAVPNAEQLLNGFFERSRDVYAHHACKRNLRYGPRPRQVFDWFDANGLWREGTDAPVLVFLHGGYWQWRSKEDFACVAAGALAAGMHVVLAEYTLAPQASMSQIVAEIGCLLDGLQTHPTLGQKPGEAPRIVLAGHSAGGHLAAMHRQHPAVAGVLSVSGLFDLGPIARGALNDALQLTDAEVASCSPRLRIGTGATTVVAVGGAELPEFQRQSAEYAAALEAVSESVQFAVLPWRNHFDILSDLEQPDGALLKAAIELAADTGRCA